MYSHVFIWGSFGGDFKRTGATTSPQIYPPFFTGEGGYFVYSTESMFGSASEIQVLVLVGSPHMDWNRLTAFALFSGCKYPHQTVHQLKLTHLLI